jgi:hypothetical protein
MFGLFEMFTATRFSPRRGSPGACTDCNLRHTHNFCEPVNIPTVALQPDVTATPCKLAHLQVLVVAHTHWDREWYHPAARFQSRLVPLVDALLRGPESVRIDAASPFLLDGQMVVLDDYLAIRPERTADIAAALQSGALEAGPWYVLADNLIPSGEAIIRNLEAGRRRLRRLGASAPPVAYCPDTFGHPAALPQIAQGFGCRVAIVWRGFGGTSFPAADTVWWESADGRRILLHHLPPDGYEYGAALPATAGEAAPRWRHMAPVLAARNTIGVKLLLSGADHHAAQPDVPSRVAHLANAASADHATVRQCGLAHAAGVLWQTANADAAPDIPTVRGELRDSYGYTWTLQGTLATRAHQKRANARLERTLLHDVEPWGVLAWLHAHHTFHTVAANGSTTLAQLPVLTQHTWDTLLRTHPHDTLCGCSSDDVASAMTARQRRVLAVIPELRQVALAGALHHDPVHVRDGGCRIDPARAQPVVIRNCSGRRRGGVAVVNVVEVLAHEPVGPGSGTVASAAIAADPLHTAKKPPAAAASGMTSPRVTTPGVADSVVQVLRTHERSLRRESPQHYPDNDRVRVHRVLAWVPPVPAYGVSIVHQHDTLRDAAAPFQPVTCTQTGSDLCLSNGITTVSVAKDGVHITMQQRTLPNALRLTTMADAGDSYTPSLRGAPEPLQIERIAVGQQGPLRSSVLVYWRWQRGRGRGRERIRVVTEIALHAGSPVVMCDIRGRNHRRNHRVQCTWHTDVTHGVVMADAAFGPVVRTTLNQAAATAPLEHPPSTMPLHRWLTTHNATGSATLISDGLAEGECTNGQLGVTLLRAIGQLSRANLPERPGHAGWPVDIPDAQSIGPFRARIGLLLGDVWSDATHDDIRDAVDDMLLPLTGDTWRDLQTTARELRGPELHGPGLHVSALHLHESSGSVVLRARNANASATNGYWILPPVGSLQARQCRLDGTPESEWETVGETLPFQIGANALVTYEVRRTPRDVRGLLPDNASPMSVHATTVTISSKPGANAIHGAISNHSRPPAIMFPQLGAGG